ncbi:hypothetical protein OAP63_13590 [Vibrio sp.]|nr:hypothetical protein [Vibrio sp.]
MESVKDHALTEDDLLAAPDSKYMNEEQLAFFEKNLLTFYQSTKEHIQQATQDNMNPMSFSDVNDRASSK